MSVPKLALSDKALRTQEQPISYLMAAAVCNPELISLAAGLVDYESLPVDEVRFLTEGLLSDRRSGQIALQYGTTQGLAELREALLEHLCRLEGCTSRDLSLSVDNCIVTGGSQQALYIVSDLLLNPGDIVITSAPTYFVYTGTLESLGARVISVEMDESGMQTDRLAEVLERLDREGQIGRVKIIYEVTYYQNPTGLSLSTDRRSQLVELARKFSRDHRILILEDAAYRELRYDGPTWPSVKRFDPENKFVILCMTFSKPFSAGLKTGYIFLPDDLVDPFLQQKGNHDFGSANFIQHLLLKAMREGVYDRHVEKVRSAYKRKRDAMLEALEEFLGYLKPDVTWIRPNGGLYTWVTLPERVDTSRGGQLFNRCLEKGVLYVPGEYCYPQQPDKPPPRNSMRLTFGDQSPERIREGIRRLSEAIGELLDGGQTTSADGSTCRS